MAGIPKGFAPYLARAARLLRSPRLMTNLAAQVGRKLSEEGSLSATLQGVRSELNTSLALLRAWLSGRYTGISGQSMVLVLAGLAYLVTPLDAIPDALPGAGLIDDLTVLSFVFNQLRQELTQFKTWQQARALNAPD